jgi:hypothetical protein
MTLRIVFCWCEKVSLVVRKEVAGELKVSESKVLIQTLAALKNKASENGSYETFLRNTSWCIEFI